MEILNLSPGLPETSRHTGQSSKDTTAALGVQGIPLTHHRISVPLLLTENAAKLLA
jgi:hypothetical protein